MPVWISAGRSPARRNWLKVMRSEEHTSELQSQSNLVCRLLLEKKKIAGTVCCDRPERRRAAGANDYGTQLPEPVHALYTRMLTDSEHSATDAHSARRAAVQRAP